MNAAKDSAKNAAIVVVGDAFLDRDVRGRVDRMAPDAPVPVFTEEQTTRRPGGAGLAALFAARAGHRVRLITALGRDDPGDEVRAMLRAAGVELIEARGAGPTVEKVRLRTDRQMVLRVDRGARPAGHGDPSRDATGRDATGRDATWSRFGDAGIVAFDAADIDSIRFGHADAILVSDYGLGLAGRAWLRSWLRDASRIAPIVWDPHPRGAPPVPGCQIVTPNEAELATLAAFAARAGADARERAEGRDGVERHEDREACEIAAGSRFAALASGSARLRADWQAAAVAVTLGAGGAMLCNGGPNPLMIPAPARGGDDACGAGDRFAASLAARLATGDLMSEAVREAVADATEFVISGGVSSLRHAAGFDGTAGFSVTAGSDPGGRDAYSLAASAHRNGGVVVATGGCFDPLSKGHVATLEAARALGDCLIVCVNSDASMRDLKGPDRPAVRAADRVALLRALSCVDATVIFDEPTPAAVITRLRPDIWVKGGDYFIDDAGAEPALPEAQLVRRWGGQCVVVPYLPDRDQRGPAVASSGQP